MGRAGGNLWVHILRSLANWTVRTTDHLRGVDRHSRPRNQG